jgi:hypothetical protein
MMAKDGYMLLAHVMQACILVFTLLNSLVGDLSYAILGALLFGLMMIPYIVEKIENVVFSYKIHLIIGFAIYFHAAGGLMGLYEIYYPVFDKIAHLWSATAVTLLGLVIVLLISRTTGALPGITLTLGIIISFTMGFGAIWEITEFFCDRFWDTGFQMGLEDTMLDLLFDLAGALLAGGWIVFRMMKSPRKLVEGTFMQVRTERTAPIPPVRDSR